MLESSVNQFICLGLQINRKDKNGWTDVFQDFTSEQVNFSPNVSFLFVVSEDSILIIV